MKRYIVMVILCASTVLASAEKQEMPKQFYIYTEAGSKLNHYIPSGWMGDYGDLKINPRPKAKPASGSTCLEIKYSGERKQDAGWAGIYWQTPANNWGDKKTKGFNLSKYKKLKFFARGERGGEIIDNFGVGGISGQTEEGDSDQATISQIELTKDWKEYEISLAGMDMSRIIGGFYFATNADVNPNGVTMYLDEIRFE